MQQGKGILLSQWQRYKLVAGGGVDTITGCRGRDTSVVNNGVAAGTVITGNSSGNSLQVAYNTDISGATISGVQSSNNNDPNFFKSAA